MLNYYQLLGVPNFAAQDEIATAYKNKYNELFSSDSPLANIPKLKQLKQALDILSDEDQRESYDQELGEFLELVNEQYEEAVYDLENRDLDSSAEKLTWCMTQNPNEPDYYETMGLVCRLQGDLKKSLRFYKQGLETGQRKGFFHRYLGDIYALMHEDEKSEEQYIIAAEEFRQLLKVDPKNVEAMEQLGDIYRHMKFFEEALDTYQQLLKRYPYNAAFHREAGSIMSEMDMLGEAESHLIEALRIKPSNAPSLMELGLVYFKKRLLGMAVQTFLDCLKADPNQPEVRQLITQIESVRKEIGQTVEEMTYDPAPDAYVEGTVKWYNKESGMGVATCESFPDVLLHYTAIKNEKDVDLKKGDAIRFGVVKDKMSPVAVEVEKIGTPSESEVLPGKITKFDTDKKLGLIKGADGSDVFFPFSALTEETLNSLAIGLDVLYETKSIVGLDDNAASQAIRVRLRKKKTAK
ncbi:MAG: cold shock domain-containing protein [Candidatus Riflebacteria bacterium]|nr:cold shock domain-containing protein [Candidatus Riflebacteria bacterium]